MKLVFMGTADFAVPVLSKIHQNTNHDLLAVVTNIDKPGGRGRKLMPSPVKVFAEEHKIPLFQPEKLKDDHFSSQLRELNADIYVVVAFKILPREVFSIPEYGTLNLHGSLLPKYRGAAPIQWAVINGETETGLTTFIIDAGIDTGGILLQEKVDIFENETYGELAVKMADIGANLLIKTLDGIQDNSIKPLGQDTKEATHAPKIKNEHMKLDFNCTAFEIKNLIRGLSPVYAAKTKCKEVNCKIYKADALIDRKSGVVGEIVKADKNEGFLVNTGEGLLSIIEIQREGKKPMHFKEFIKGMPFKIGDIFS